MYYILLIAGSLGLVFGAIYAAQRPDFWIGLVKKVVSLLLPDILKIFKNRPKTPEEWEDWRRLSSMKKSDMSPRDKDRYEELKKLNEEYRKNN